ncbi:MAG: hypothetical protein AAF460_09545, partial [Pseudomonadota bacterium]
MVHVNVQVGPTVKFGPMMMIVLVALNVPGCQLDKKAMKDSPDCRDEVISGSSNFGGVVDKNGFHGLLPVESYFHRSCGDSVH